MPITYQTRLITAQDYPAMTKIIINYIFDESGLRQHGDPYEDYLAHLFDKEQFLVYYVVEAIDSDKGLTTLIGGGGIQDCQYDSPDHPKTCELSRFYYAKDYRGQGHGSALLARLTADAEQRGYAHMLIETVPGYMQHAIEFYQRKGFKLTDDSPTVVWGETHGIKHCFLQRQLTPAPVQYLKTSLTDASHALLWQPGADVSAPTAAPKPSSLIRH